MEQLQRETISMSRDEKLKVLRGLMACVDQATGKATRDFELRMALGAVVTVPQSEIVRTVTWLMGKVR